MVSIIIPVFNSQNYIRQCIQSVINQSYTKWEMILIDDFSTDDSREIISEYVSIDSRIKSHCFNKNVGAGIARNMGIKMAKERFIAFLDSDDYWHKDKLKDQIEFMLFNKIKFSYTRYFELNHNDKPSKIILSPRLLNSKQLLLNNYIKTLTVIYDTKEIGKIYMPEYRKRQDWGLWFNILEKTRTAHCLTKPLAYYRTSNASLSKNKVLLIKENFNFYRLFLKKNAFVSAFMMVLFLIVHLHFKTFGFEKTFKKEY